MKIQEYKGPAGAMKDSEWLSSEDLPEGRDVTVTIESVVMVTGATFAGGRKKDGGALTFVGKAKKLLLNSTNRKTLVRLFGATTGGWFGKTIQIYVDPNVSFGGKKVSGVRIRDTVASQGKTDAEQLIGDDDHDDVPMSSPDAEPPPTT